MAKKFNDGQTFGEIRQILNDNADDINTAQTMAEKLASQGVTGRVANYPFMSQFLPSLSDINNIFQQGALAFKDGFGVPMARYLTKFDFAPANPKYEFMAYGVPVYLSGTMGMVGGVNNSFDYTNGYAKRYVQGIMMLVYGLIVVFDVNHGEIWMRSFPAFTPAIPWTKMGGGTDYTLPVASASTLGGIKVGTGLSITNGVLSVAGDSSDASELKTIALEAGADFPPFPSAGMKVYTFDHPIQDLPERLADYDYSGVLTVYPGYIATLIVSGIPEDPDEQEGAPYLSPNGLWTLASGWHKSYEVSFPGFPQRVKSTNESTTTGTGNGKEVKDTNGK